MRLNDVLFSVHEYDFEGDIVHEGVFLHFGETRVKVAETVGEFERLCSRISGMVPEIKENYDIN